jgi:hypothetical protein
MNPSSRSERPPIRAEPTVIVIAGPNGAGKTTYAESVLRILGIREFVNADRIAQGLSGLNTDSVAIEAGRLMLRRLRVLSAERASFGFETTLSSRSFAPFLRGLCEQGLSREDLLCHVAVSSRGLSPGSTARRNGWPQCAARRRLSPICTQRCQPL